MSDPSRFRSSFLTAHACAGVFVGAIFASLQHLIHGHKEPLVIAIAIFVVLSYAYLVKTLATSIWRAEYHEPWEHGAGLLATIISHWFFYNLI